MDSCEQLDQYVRNLNVDGWEEWSTHCLPIGFGNPLPRAWSFTIAQCSTVLEYQGEPEAAAALIVMELKRALWRVGLKPCHTHNCHGVYFEMVSDGTLFPVGRCTIYLFCPQGVEPKSAPRHVVFPNVVTLQEWSEEDHI